MSSGNRLMTLAMLFGLAAYCIVLLISKEAPVTLLAAVGVTSLILVVTTTWSHWNFLRKEPISNEEQGDNYQQESRAGHE